MSTTAEPRHRWTSFLNLDAIIVTASVDEARYEDFYVPSFRPSLIQLASSGRSDSLTRNSNETA